MNKEFKQPFIDALRSDKYEQTNGQLREKTPEGFAYCCLGVYCIVRGWAISDDGLHILDKDGHSIGYEPLDNELSNKSVDELCRMNDIDKATFEKIADFVETNL